MDHSGIRGVRTVITLALQGLAAGALATIPMSGIFVLGETLGVRGTKPPRRIIDEVLPDLPDHTADAAALAAHFGFGALCGALYSVLTARAKRTPASGIAFGFAIWAVSYEGWLCITGILPPAHRDDRGRALTVLAAHGVYGVALARAASVIQSMLSKSTSSSAGPRRAALCR